MVATNQTNVLERIVKVASAGFLLYGYHGYSMQECEKAVGLNKGMLDHYVHNKIDLAHRIMQTVTEDAKQMICTNQWPFSLTYGFQLAVLPARLWISNDKALQIIIRSYYDDWRLAFIGDALSSNDSYHDKMYQQGNQTFLTWLGFWFTRQMGLSAIEMILP